MPVKLYVGEHYREPKLFTHTELLFPFWGVAAKESTPYVRTAALQHQYSKEDFMLVDHIEDADYVLIPYNYDRLKAANPARLSMIIEEAHAAGKPLLIDGAGDIEHSIDIPNSVVMRVSQYRYNARPNEITIPFPAEDLLESYRGGKLEVRKKQEKPSVGFTGWAAYASRARLKMMLKQPIVTFAARLGLRRGAEEKGIVFRKRALAALNSDPRIEAHFTARPNYSGNARTIRGDITNTRIQFVENLVANDYALCVKGDGNASVRFYEALSMGRIPLFLDTACVLPLEDTIDYRSFCLFVDWREVNQLGERLVSFHGALTSDRFQAMQEAARDAYTRYLRVDSFSKWLARDLHARLTAKPRESE